MLPTSAASRRHLEELSLPCALHDSMRYLTSVDHACLVVDEPSHSRTMTTIMSGGRGLQLRGDAMGAPTRDGRPSLHHLRGHLGDDAR
eukprot:5519178-Pyramimonas_sp.AAC.1